MMDRICICGGGALGHVIASWISGHHHVRVFDQIVLSRPVVKAKKGLRYDHSEVFIRDYLIQQDGKYKGAPLRTHGGRVWLNGYSDHLPTIVYLKK